MTQAACAPVQNMGTDAQHRTSPLAREREHDNRDHIARLSSDTAGTAAVGWLVLNVKHQSQKMPFQLVDVERLDQ
jgi:hypothetical protein